MPKEKTPGPSVKKPKTYEALKDKGVSKERAAKISNARDRLADWRDATGIQCRRKRVRWVAVR